MSDNYTPDYNPDIESGYELVLTCNWCDFEEPYNANREGDECEQCCMGRMKLREPDDPYGGA